MYMDCAANKHVQGMLLAAAEHVVKLDDRNWNDGLLLETEGNPLGMRCVSIQSIRVDTNLRIVAKSRTIRQPDPPPFPPAIIPPYCQYLLLKTSLVK